MIIWGLYLSALTRGLIILVALFWLALFVDAFIRWRRRRKERDRASQDVGLRTGLSRHTYRGEHRA